MNFGTINYSTTLKFLGGANGTFDNWGTFQITNAYDLDRTLGGAVPPMTFNNLGTFTQLAFAGTTTYSQVKLDFNNYGTVNANNASGGITFVAAGIHKGLFFAVAQATIEFAKSSVLPALAGIQTLNSGVTFNGDGLYLVAAGSRWNVQNGVTVRANNFRLDETGAIETAGDQSQLIVDGTASFKRFEWDGGAVRGAGIFTVGPTDYAFLTSVDDKHLNTISFLDYGAVDWFDGNIDFESKATLTIGNSLFGGVFNVRTGDTMTNDNTATGLITLQSNGTLQNLDAKPPATIKVPVINQGGQLIVNSPGINLTNGYGQINGTTTVNGGIITLTATFEEDAGTVTVATNSKLSVGANYLLTGGTLTAQGAGSLVSVAGDFNQSGGVSTFGQYATTLATTGAISLTGGSMNIAYLGVSAGNGMGIGSGGTLYCGSSASVIGNLTNGGTLVLDTVSSVGSLAISGNFTTTGTLVVGLISGTSYSKLTASGNVSLSGTLTVQDINGFRPYNGTFNLITAGGLLGGDFTHFNWAPLGPPPPPYHSDHWQDEPNTPPGTFSIAVIDTV